MQEKEALDIGDSNAAALHPDQFRHINPSSPGGALNARKTRGARHRAGDPDDLPSAATAQENRRKRKAAFDDTEGSPGPAARQLEAAGSPYKDAKAKLIHTQYDAPLYSIERLFTEKELALNMNLANVAAQNFLVKLKPNGSTDGTNGVNGHAYDDHTPAIPTIIGDAMDQDDDSTPAAVEMDRTAGASSYSVHQTRGATRNALTDLASIAEGRLPFAATNIPQFAPAIMGAKANGAAPGPAPLTSSELEQDFALIGRPGFDFDDPINNQILAYAADQRRPTAFVEYRYQPPALNGLDKDDIVGSAANALLAGVGGVAMSRQTSRGGMSDAGGPGASVPMSRTGNGSSMGGLGLRRTASGLGRELLAGGDGMGSGRRGRGRGAA